MVSFHFGCSGWSYTDWKGNFYNYDIKNNDMLLFYSKVFKIVEINTTFYNLPRLEFVKNWVKKTPIDFIFAVKFPQYLTHEKLYEDKVVEKDLIPFIHVIEALKPKLGPILIQFRPKFEKDINKLESFLSILPSNYEYAIEFRHSSWIEESTFSLLEKYKMSYCIIDEPYKSKKTLIPPILKVTTNFSYFRWHGLNPSHWYDYLYSEEQLKEWKDKIETVSDSVEKVYGFFNNHPNGQAPTNCLQLLKLFGKKTRDPKSFAIKRGKIVKNAKSLETYF